MLQAFKDATYLYPCSSDRPLTLVASDRGGVKDTSLFIQLAGITYPAGSVFSYGPTGPDLLAENAAYSITVKDVLQSWQVVLPNTSSFKVVTGATQLSLGVRLTGKPVASPFVSFTTSIRIVLLNPAGDTLDFLSVPVQVVLAEQGLPVRYRLLTGDRQVPAVPAGFTFGKYRWRADQNANVLLPTNWSQDVKVIGSDKFLPGIGVNDDLKMNRLYRSNHSILPIVQAGDYFLGPNRYYMPSKDSRLEIFPVSPDGGSYTLSATPDFGKPLFVGSYQTGPSGTFDADVRYRSLGKGIASSDGGWDPTSSDYQFQLVRKTRTLTINKGFTAGDVFVSLFPQASDPDATSLTATFDLPAYPVWQVTGVYLNSPDNGVSDYSFDREKGQITVTVSPNDVGSRVVVRYLPAIAVIYGTADTEADPSDPLASGIGERMLDRTELNPAFSGLSSGFLYLLHRRQKATEITLSVDKPLIPIPATAASIVGLVAYGPVYYENDFALLTARVTGSSADQAIPGIELVSVPGDSFQGFLNYQDPLQTPLRVTTGGDGVAPLIYTTGKNYGYYLDPAASVSNGNRFTLPADVPLSQLWNVADGWYLKTYWVETDDPVLGKIGANTNFGEVPFTKSGTPGTVGYKTNGLRNLWIDSSGKAIIPTQVYDSAAKPAFSAAGAYIGAQNGFNGNAHQIEYPVAFPTAAAIGAYFIGFVGRVLLQMRDVETGLLSNTIMLQLEPPPQIVDTPPVQGYLYLESATAAKMGRLEVNRLGGAPLPQVQFYASKY